MEESLTGKQNPLMVEFVGLPGVGKTTVSQQVALRLRAEGLQLVLRDEILRQWQQKKLWQKLFTLFPSDANYWDILLNSLVFAFQVKPINWQSFLKAGKILANITRNDTVASAKDCQIILLDQGVLQETWSVAISGSPPQIKYLKQEMTSLFYRRSIIIIYCQADIDTALYRIQNRSKTTSRFDLMDSKTAYSLLSKYLFYLQEIINCAQNLEIPILEIDSSLSVEEQSTQIGDWINSQLI